MSGGHIVAEREVAGTCQKSYKRQASSCNTTRPVPIPSSLARA